MSENFLPGIPPKEVIDYYRKKVPQTAYDWRDVWREENIASFQVAKAMSMDVQRELYESIDKAISDGVPFQQFKKELVPKLQKLGWWGETEVIDPKTGEKKLVNITPYRLQRIYETNINTAYAAGRWEKIQRTKAAFPYLIYQLGASREHRVDHVRWANTVLPVDHEFWRLHYPPNGWGCKCWVKQVSRSEYKRILDQGSPTGEFTPKLDATGKPTGHVTPQVKPIKTEPPPTEMIEWTNKRTGKTYKIPKGIDPGFGMNWGMRGGGCGSMVDTNRELLLPDSDLILVLNASKSAAKSCNLLSKEQKLKESEAALAETEQRLQNKYKSLTPENSDKFLKTDPDPIEEVDDPNEISDNERLAMKLYTGEKGKGNKPAPCYLLNQSLRTGKDTFSDKNRKLDVVAERISSTIKKLPKHEGTVKRAMDIHDDASGKKDKQHLKAFLSQATAGSTYTFKEFTSTTRKENPPFTGNIRFVIGAKGKNGASIDEFSRFSTEQEVLFDKGTSFNIKTAKWRSPKHPELRDYDPSKHDELPVDAEIIIEMDEAVEDVATQSQQGITEIMTRPKWLDDIKCFTQPNFSVAGREFIPLSLFIRWQTNEDMQEYIEDIAVGQRQSARELGASESDIEANYPLPEGTTEEFWIARKQAKGLSDKELNQRFPIPPQAVRLKYYTHIFLTVEEIRGEFQSLSREERVERVREENTGAVPDHVLEVLLDLAGK